MSTCIGCDQYVQTFRTVLQPVVGRAMSSSDRPVKPADVLARIRAGAHRRNHQVSTPTDGEQRLLRAIFGDHS